MNEASLSDTLLRYEASSMAIRPNDRNWFVRLYNFNPNWEYYISPVHEIKTNLVS